MSSVIETVTENAQIAKAYKDLLRISYQKLTATDKKMIRLALDTAVDAHKDQRRKSGEPYILHPIAVAKIVANDIGLGAPSIAAALLHDVQVVHRCIVFRMLSLFVCVAALYPLFAYCAIDQQF